MFTLVLRFVLLVTTAQAISYQHLFEDQWQEFKLKHGKFYQDEQEEAYRQNIFMQNLHTHTKHNEMYEMGLTTYQMGTTQFSDLTEKEFLRRYTVDMPALDIQKAGLLGDNVDDFLIFEPPMEVNVSNLPTAVDWTKNGAVTPVKNQGQCGSCWAFSATGALEAQWFKKTKHLISLSEQNLVDCSWKYGNHGCNGGWMHSAFRYIHDNGGIDTEQSYPYNAHNGACHYMRRAKGATVDRSVMFKGEAQLQDKVTHVGPISVAIEVRPSLMHYTRGVYSDPHCGHSINHAVLVVGYGSQGGHDYWLIKNSWGTGWGEGGYVKMIRHRNMCGVANWPTYPVV